MLKTAFLLVFLGSFAGVYGAPCLPGTITSYEALSSGGCTVGGVTFSNFSLLEDSASESNDFLISPSVLSSPGFDISYLLGSTTSVVDYAIQYSFDPPPAIGSAFLGLDVEGSVTVTEGICPGGVFTSDAHNPTGCIPTGSLLDPPPVVLTVSNPNGNLNAYATFPPVTVGEVRLVFNLDGTPTDPAGFTTVSATLSSTPEPATFVLLLSGLIGIGVYKRKARQ